MLTTKRQAGSTDFVHTFHIMNNIIFNCLPTVCLSVFIDIKFYF